MCFFKKKTLDNFHPIYRIGKITTAITSSKSIAPYSMMYCWKDLIMSFLTLQYIVECAVFDEVIWGRKTRKSRLQRDLTFFDPKLLK